MLHLFAIIFSLQNFERLRKLTADVKIDEVVSCLVVWRRLLLKKLRYNNKSRKMQVTVCYVKETQPASYIQFVNWDYISCSH